MGCTVGYSLTDQADCYKQAASGSASMAYRLKTIALLIHGSNPCPMALSGIRS